MVSLLELTSSTFSPTGVDVLPGQMIFDLSTNTIMCWGSDNLHIFLNDLDELSKAFEMRFVPSKVQDATSGSVKIYAQFLHRPLR